MFSSTVVLLLLVRVALVLSENDAEAGELLRIWSAQSAVEVELWF